MGTIADELRERSKFDNKMIVGSEIRAAICEVEAERDTLQQEVAELEVELTNHAERRARNIVTDLRHENDTLQQRVKELEGDNKAYATVGEHAVKQLLRVWKHINPQVGLGYIVTDVVNNYCTLDD